MTNGEIKALISLLDDEDTEVKAHVESKIKDLGDSIIPFLEQEWEESLNPDFQRKIENLIHELQFSSVEDRLIRWKEQGGEDLLEGMWLLNTYQYPDADLSLMNQTLEQIYYEAWVHVKPDMHPLDQVRALNTVLFKNFRFSANTKNFHSPANSMLNQVLESKKGNPLTLCVVYMLIAQKLKMPVYGVNLPNLFILTYKMEGLQFYINAYNRGLVLSKSDIDNYIQQLNLKQMDIFYEPCSNIDIIRRALRNLIVAYEKMDDPERAAEITKLLDILSEGDAISPTDG